MDAIDKLCFDGHKKIKIVYSDSAPREVNISSGAPFGPEVIAEVQRLKDLGASVCPMSDRAIKCGTLRSVHQSSDLAAALAQVLIEKGYEVTLLSWTEDIEASAKTQ